MAKNITVRWIILGVLFAVLAGCGRMLPVGGRDDLIKYRVKKGETLYSISWRYGYDHREVAAWNNIKPPYHIYVGQQLYIIPPHQKYARARRDNTPGREPAAGQVKTSPAVLKPSTVAKTQSKKTPNRVDKRSSKRKQQSIAWRWPSQGKLIARFNPGKGKKGLDISGKLGQSIKAAADGNVVYSGNGLRGYGNLVIIKHSDTFLSAYGHNRRLLVKEGTAVKQGQKIAEMGESGKDGVILHFEIRRDGKPVNPLAYLPKQRN